MIVAKFYVREITTYAHSADQTKVILSVVTRGEENKSWSKWTPSGTIEMTITNPDAVFEIGKEYTVTFEVDTPA